MRTNGWQSSFLASSASTFSIRTDDPSLSTTMAPVMTVVLGFGRQSGLQAVSTQPALPQPPPAPASIANLLPDVAGHLADTDGRPADVAGSESSAPDSPTAGDLYDSSPEESEPGVASESGGARARGERLLRLIDPPSASAEPDSRSPAEPGTDEAEPEPTRPAHPHRLEMTIDSLPHHDLTEPIPIHIDPLGDTVFTATVSNLDISATGNSIGEALVLLKEQIEFIYGDLNRRTKRSPDQTTMLAMLHTYIEPTGTKPAWL
jgi:hypothetical protein